MDKRFFIHGFLPAFGSASCFAVMASMIKIAAADLPVIELVFLRSIVGLFIIIPFVVPRGITFIYTKKLKLHLLRALVSLCAMNCYFYGIGHIGLSETTLLNATSPLFVGILASLFLGEKLNKFIILALIIGFVGASLILKPGTQLFTLAAFIALASGLFIACAKILVRYMSDTEPVLRTVFYFSLLCTLYSAVPLAWFWVPLTNKSLICMILAGICATAGQTLLTYAFSNNEAVKVAPFTYVTVLVATLIGWFAWQELPDLGSSIGSILVMAACLCIIFQGKLPNPWKIK